MVSDHVRISLNFQNQNIKLELPCRYERKVFVRQIVLSKWIFFQTNDSTVAGDDVQGVSSVDDLDDKSSTHDEDIRSRDNKVSKFSKQKRNQVLTQQNAAFLRNEFPFKLKTN